MYTINKVKGLLFLAAINVITFTFLTVHRASVLYTKLQLCSGRNLLAKFVFSLSFSFFICHTKSKAS